MQNTASQEGHESSAGFSRWGRSTLTTHLQSIGVKTTWQENMYRTLAGRIGLGGEAFMRHPDYDKQWDLGYNRNLVHAFAALVLWSLFAWFIFFQLFHATCDLHNLTSCITSQQMQAKPWDETVDSSSAVVYIRSMNKHLSLELTVCLITNGDYASYKKNRALNRIDPVEGGCATPEVVNLSSEQALKTLVGDGGCKLFESDNAYRYGWCHKVSSPVVGQFGDPAFRFVKINVIANAKDMFAAGNYTNLDFIYPEFVGGKKDDYNSVYYTFDPFYPMKKEMFFQRTEIVKHSSLEFLSNENSKAEKTYLQYHHEYNRWERSNTGGSGQIRSDALAQETLTVATIYLRATSSRIVYDERQVKTLYDFPKDAGGFWTACLFIGAFGYFLLNMAFPKRVVDFSGLLQREHNKEIERQRVLDTVLASHEVAKVKQTLAVSHASTAFVDGRAIRAENCQSIELRDDCQHLEEQAPPKQSRDDDDDDGLRVEQSVKLPRFLGL